MSEAKVPVKVYGVEVGVATVSNNGALNIHLEPKNGIGDELLEHIQNGLVFGLSVNPILNPAVDGNLVSRLDNQRSIEDLGGIRPQGDGNSLIHIMHPFVD